MKKGDFKKGQTPWNKGKKHTPEHLHNQSEAHKGFVPSLETRKKLSIAAKGKTTWIKGKKVGPRSEETKRKISEAQKGKPRKKHTEETRRMLSEMNKGEKSYLWKGGITPENNKIRISLEYRLFKEAVFARDNWTCQKYMKRGGDLVAHHLQNFSSVPELRTSISNGITLSEKAHKEFHKKYGFKNNTKEQIEEFIGRKL